MNSRNSIASVVTTGVVAIGFLAIAPGVHAKSPGKHAESTRTYVLESKRRGRGPKIYLPMGPSYIYYDYPYYYSRGYYPTHIGGYVYYRPYYGRREYRDRVSSRRHKARRN